MNHYFILSLIIITLGLIGGLINYFRLSIRSSKNNNALIKSILTGLGASILVPLFLQMISSDLLTSSQSNPIHYFVIAGFCLISSIFSSKFIDSIGEKILNQIEEVSKDIEEVKSDLDIATIENEISNSEINEEIIDLDDKEILILQKIDSSKYTYRSISGLASDTALSKEDVNQLLEKLLIKEYVIKSLRNNNSYKWRLSPKGYRVVSELCNDESWSIDEGSGSGS